MNILMISSCAWHISNFSYRDSRVPTLIRNCIQTNQRGLLLLVGDESKDVIAKLYYVLSQLNPKCNKSVLWAYSKKLLGTYLIPS